MFDINVALCDRFPALSPFDVRSQPFCEVVLIFSRLIDKQRRTGAQGDFNAAKKEDVKGKLVVRDKSGKIISVMVPAQNDDWY